MAAAVSKFIVRTLCDHHGGLDFGQLEEKVSRSYTVDGSVLRGVLFDDGKIAIREGGGGQADGRILSPDSLLAAKTALRLCQQKPGECGGCEALHLCRYLVCGDCTFGLKCKNPHSLESHCNAELLRRYGVENLTEKQLFQLLLQNDPYLLPEICSHYNKGDGLHGSCKFTTSCTKLHVCQHYFQGDCMFGSKCKRAHHVDAHGKIFKGYSQENIQHLDEIYRNKFIIMYPRKRPAAVVPALPVLSNPTQSHSNPGSTSSASPSKPVSDVDRNEICLFFICKHCSFKEKCARVHWHLPYRWQVLDSDGVTWKDLPDMEGIEKAYCDPERDKNTTEQPPTTSGIFSFLSFQSSPPLAVEAVNFMTMTYKGSVVRRLSTASSVSKPPYFILTTQWLWYWKDERGKWLEYGQGDSSITSQTLEKMYLLDRDLEIPFSAGKQQYILHFKDPKGGQLMYQQNVNYKTKREVRRRPRFVSAHDVVMIKNSSSSSSHSSGSSTAESFPSHWDKTALPDLGYKLIPLSKSMKEYDMIEMLFKRTMPQGKLKSIQRIQNPSLWKVFQWQKEQMMAKNGGRVVNEQYLFHGTDASLIEAICEQNFDWRMCGVHGTAYGKGSYFARDACLSDRYAAAKGNVNKNMFVALILVGEYVRGSSSYVRPPPKAGNNRAFYDSCVDRESDPSIYVVFEKQQIYPEYLINYT